MDERTEWEITRNTNRRAIFFLCFSTRKETVATLVLDVRRLLYCHAFKGWKIVCLFCGKKAADSH